MSITELDIDRLYNILDMLKSKPNNDEMNDKISSLKKAIFILENNY